jgi:DNA-binding NtrC family response regulator
MRACPRTLFEPVTAATEPVEPHGDLLFVDDDPEVRTVLVRRFQRRQFHTSEAGDGQQALDVLERRDFDVAIVDIDMPNMSGMELLERLKNAGNECEVIMLTGQGSIETAVKAMKLGAIDYLTKPVALDALEVVVQKALNARRLRKENDQLKVVLERNHRPAKMIGQSPPMLEVFRLIERAAPTDRPILIQGESGTGKELVARAIHEHSPLRDKPLVVINCAALPETLLESELFGYEKGTFTGAVAAKAGLFEIADGGTLFIDEIGELAGALQAKLLRVLEDGSMRRIGSLKERRVKVRIISATNRDLAAEVKAMRFREDLYYRINVMTIEMPPLRTRSGDIAMLVKHLVGGDWHVEPAALHAMEQYTWPGNVRQLYNALERAKIMSDDRTIRAEYLPPEVRQAAGIANPAVTLARAAPPPPRSSLDAITGDNLTELKRLHILSILEREQGNKARAARALGVSRRKLYRLLEKYKIE